MRKKYTITKKNTRKKTEITCVDNDNWFYSVNEIDSRKNLYKGMILEKDLFMWLENYRQKGYSVSEEDI